MPPTRPTVSVVMCAYNTRPYIEQAVRSVLQQTFECWELIISDDASTDGTREWLQRLRDHPKVRLFFQPKNIGYVANKNFAFEQASGEYITQNDSDDLSAPDRLEKQLSAISRSPGIRIVGCGYAKVNSQNICYKEVSSNHEILIPEYQGQYPFWFPSLLLHREVYQRIGCFSRFFAGIGDDLYWTVRANEIYSILCIPDILYSYRYNPMSITNVLDDDRKLLAPAILKELIRQRQNLGTDWLEQNNLEALRNLEEELRNDTKFMSSQYRIWAAKAIDKKQMKRGRDLLFKAMRLNPWQIENLSTLSYYLRVCMSI
jgi:glycosyltransferase involved in cell wall biosynthesis